MSIVEAMLIHGMIVQGRADDKHYGVAVTVLLRKKTLLNARSLVEELPV